MTAAKFILPVLAAAAMTRRLGAELYGVVTYTAAVMNYFLMLFDFGFNYAAAGRIARCREDTRAVENITAAVFTAKGALVLIGALILALIIPFTAMLREYAVFVWLYYLATAVSILVPDFVYRGLQQMQFVTLRYVLARLVSTVLIVMLVHGPAGILWIPLSYTLGTVTTAWYTLFHLRRTHGVRLRFSLPQQVFSELRFAWPFFLSQFAATGLSIFCTVVMGFAGMPSEEIAYWSVSYQVIQAIQSMYDPITGAMHPHTARGGDWRFVLRVTAVLTVCVAAGCSLMYLLAGFIIRVLSGTGYEAAVPLLRLMLPMALLSFPEQMLGFPLLGAMGRQKQMTVTTVTAAAVQVGGTFLMLAAGVFTLSRMAILRDISEGILLAFRALFVIGLVRDRNGAEQLIQEE